MDATPTTPDQSVPPNVAADPSAQSSWAQAAQPIPLDKSAGPVANAPKPAEMQPEQASSTGTVAQQPNPDALPPETRALKPLQRGGLFGFMDKVGDLMAGKTRPELAKDEDGNVYVKQVNLTGAEKWARIAGTALKGAAAGFAAGRGNNLGAAAAAGVQAGVQQQDQQHQNQQEMTAEARQQTLDNANRQALRMKMAEQAWDFTHHQIEANQADIKFANEQVDRLTDPKHGGVVVGVAAHPGDIGNILHVQPDIMEQLVKEGTVETVPHYDADGKAAGVSVVLMPKDYKTQVAPSGTPFPTFNKVTGEYDWHKASDATPWGRIDDYWSAAGADRLKFANDKAVQDKNEAETAKTKSESAKTDVEAKTLIPSEVAKNKAEASRAYAEAAKAGTENFILKQNQVVGGEGAQNLTHDQIVDGMLHGKVDITKAVGIFKDPHAREQYIADALAKDPTWTMQKYQAMMKMRQDMTSGKIGDKITSFNTFLGHASVVDDGVNTLRNGNSPLINHTVNWLRTNATNNPVVAGMLPEIDATRNEFQNFITNHALQKSEIERGEKLLNEDQTPAQMQASLKSFMQVALTKLGAVKSQVNETMGSDTPEMITPRNAQAIRNLGLEQYANNYGLMVNHPAPATAPPTGAVGTAMSKLDNKFHYVSQTGQDLGIAPQ